MEKFSGKKNYEWSCFFGVEPVAVDEISSILQYSRQLLHIQEMLSKDSSFHMHRRCKEKQPEKGLKMPKSAETELPKQ